MTQKNTEPKNASAVVLLNERGEICWAQRSASLAFLPRYHAFPGGKVDENDSEIQVKNCADEKTQTLIACAVRETFEEVGVLLVRNGEKLTNGQRASLHEELISGRSKFSEILNHWVLWIDASDFTFIGRWTTPPFSPMRFRTSFFLARCPQKQKPFSATTELESVEFINPEIALNLWKQSKVLLTPPTLTTIKVFADSNLIVSEKVEKLVEISETEGIQPRKIEINPRITMFPLKTPTLPPATHTNCFVVGGKEFIVIDAASADKDEQKVFHEFIDSRIESGDQPKEIIVTHSHRDHFGGEMDLQKHLLEKFGLEIPISAHQMTAKSLEEKVEFQRFVEDEANFSLLGKDGKPFEVKAFLASGHARGQLCFYDEELGFLLSGDNVVALGSVVIAPPEGKMIDYFQSLERLKNLPNLRFLCGSHGAAVFDARAKIEQYISHRIQREQEILEKFTNGCKTTKQLVEQIYIGLNPELLSLAEKTVEAHLEKLREEGKI